MRLAPVITLVEESDLANRFTSVLQVGLNQVGLNQVDLNKVGLNQPGLNQVGMNQVGMNQAGMGPIGLAPAAAAQDRSGFDSGFVSPSAEAGLVSKRITGTWAKVDVGEESSAANQPATAQQEDPGFVAFLRDNREALIAFLRKSAASHEDAQDIAQETMMRMLRYRDQPADALKILMYRIAINALNDRGRRQKTRHAPEHVSLDEDYHALPSQEPSHDQRVATEQELALVRTAIMQLPVRSRQIYLLNRINGMSYTQIAKHCGISVKAVEKNIGRALALLRARMKESGYETLQEP